MQKATASDLRGTDMCAKELQVTRTALIRYRSAMAGVVRSIGVSGPTVEDVVHDAFEMACRKPELERPDPNDEGGFQAWLCTLARYAALTARNDNARSREVASPAEDLEDVPEPNRAYIGRYDDKVAASIVLANLDADDRSLLHEHFYEDKTVQELAAERGVPWTTMRSRLDGVIHRARTIMDDRAVRRRGLGASLLMWLSVSITEVCSRLYASWSRSKQLVAVGAAGLILTGAFLGVSKHFHHELAVSSVTSSMTTLAAAHPEAQAPQSDGVIARAAMTQKSGSKATLPTLSDDSLVSKTKAATKANVRPAATVEDEDRSRAIVPWGVAAVLRDEDQRKK